MGFVHGSAFAQDIGLLTEERLRLATDPTWTGGRSASMAEVEFLGNACLAELEAFSPSLMSEMRGMADATGIDLNSLVIMNGFTDFVDIVANDRNAEQVLAARNIAFNDDMDGCTAFVVDGSVTAAGRPFIGQTWDMHSSATPHVILLDLQPTGAPSSLAFSITGCVGMIGINEHGVSIGINNILGADGRVGVHWPYVVREMLARETIDSALDVLRTARLSGAHNYVVMGPDAAGQIQGYNVEATATRSCVTHVASFNAHSNHCVDEGLQPFERPRKALSLTSTCNRLDQALAFLSEHSGKITLDDIMAMTRYHADREMSICAHAHPEYDVESSGACIMSPETREMWALWGLPCQNEYERFTVERHAAH
jgi:isopenicillin-N N-acyltransferase-like protein